MASACSAVVSVNVNRCPHHEGILCINPFPKRTTLAQVWYTYHPPPAQKGDSCKILGTRTENKNEAGVTLEETLTLADVEQFGIKYLSFTCRTEKDSREMTEFKEVVEATTQKAMNAFEILMAKGREFPDKRKSSSGKPSGLNRKDELYNDILEGYVRNSGLDFPKGIAQTQGILFVQTICNALWYVTNHHETINAAAKRQAKVSPIPEAFDSFTGYNDCRRKKAKAQQLCSSDLESNTQALYSLLQKPYMNNSEAWQKAYDDIKSLADCLKDYSNHLKTRNDQQKLYHALPHPVRTVGESTTVENRKAWVGTLPEKYRLLDKAVRDAGLNNPVFFNESEFVNPPFENNMQRHRYFNDVCLTVPIDIYRFAPGGSVFTSYSVLQVEENRSEPQMLTNAARMAKNMNETFSEFHTREQRRVFKQKLSHVANVMPAVADLIYKELCIDRASAAHPDTQERLRLIFLGEEGLLTDLRHLNQGRPSDYFDVFFEHLSNLVEEVTAEDERRHNTAHLSQWISLSDMIDMAAQRCPENTPIPSKSLVRLQFAPRNPYAKTAHSFTSKIDVQYKIQRRQLRATHMDQHYCAAQFRYFKEKAVELGDKCIVLCCDDKAKVPIGEPGFSVSTGVRGKKTIAPSGTTLLAADHDMTKASLTPSVILQVDVPETADRSFVQGQVSVSVNDSVFQVSTPMRHAASLSKVVPLASTKILMKFSDGGTDHRTTLEHVRCAAICLFREFDLDMVILARCAPGHSWKNPAERVMSILNLGLQNCALERESTGEQLEKKLKSCSSMQSVRDAAAKQPDLKTAWIDSVEPVQSVVRNRFQKLKLKEKPFKTFDPVEDDEIDVLRRHLRELFPNLDLGKLQKVFTSKCEAFQQWMEIHCRDRHYTFQIRKCSDQNCCLPPSSAAEDLAWLPDPVLKPDGEHYLKYLETKGLDTSETDRPSLKAKPKVKSKTTKRKHQEVNDFQESTIPVNQESIDAPAAPHYDASMYTGQNARATTNCTECRKPRVVYGKQKMSSREQMTFALLVSEFDYTCGAPLAPPDSSLSNKYCTRSTLTCNTPVELAYYNGNLNSAKDTCAHCGYGGGTVNMELKKRYKTVLPICEHCVQSGEQAIVHRPFGK